MNSLPERDLNRPQESSEWTCAMCGSGDFCLDDTMPVEMYAQPYHLDCALQIVGRDLLILHGKDAEAARWIAKAAEIELARRAKR